MTKKIGYKCATALETVSSFHLSGEKKKNSIAVWSSLTMNLHSRWLKTCVLLHESTLCRWYSQFEMNKIEGATQKRTTKNKKKMKWMERHHDKDESKSLTPHKNKSNSFGSVCDARVTFLKYSHNRWRDKIICKKFGKCEATQNT